MWVSAGVDTVTASSGGHEPGEVVDHRGVGVLGGHERLPLGGPGRDRNELALGGGGDQRGMEVPGPEAVADQPELDRGDRAPLRAGTHPHRFPLGSGGNPRCGRVGSGGGGPVAVG